MSETELDTLKESHSLFQQNKKKIIHHIQDSYVNFWIFINSGAMLFQYAPTYKILHPDLIGGLFSAIQSFSLDVMKNQMEHIALSGRNFIFYNEPTSPEGLFIVGAFDKEIDSKYAERRLRTIYQLFSKKYKEIYEKGKFHQTNTQVYRDFNRIIIVNNLYKLDD